MDSEQFTVRARVDRDTKVGATQRRNIDDEPSVEKVPGRSFTGGGERGGLEGCSRYAA
jgi:hypothetical protein